MCSGCQTEFVFPVPLPTAHGAGSAKKEPGRKEALTPEDEAYVNQFRAEMAVGLRDLNFCKKCGDVVSQGATFCTKCGTPVAPTGESPLPAPPTGARTPLYARPAPPGYENTFARFDAVGGKFLWTWNWAAFGGGAIWFFVKGLPLRGSLWLVGAIVGGFLTMFTATFAMFFVGAVLANWVYYHKERSGVEEWSPKA